MQKRKYHKPKIVQFDYFFGLFMQLVYGSENVTNVKILNKTRYRLKFGDSKN